MICNWVGERQAAGRRDRGSAWSIHKKLVPSKHPLAIFWCWYWWLESLIIFNSFHFLPRLQTGLGRTLAISRFPNTGEDYYSPRIMTSWCFCLTKQHKFQSIERFISQSPASVFVQYTIMGITTKNACISIHLYLLASAPASDTAVFVGYIKRPDGLLSLLISGNAVLMPSAGCWMLDPPAVSSITVITDTFCTHNDAGIEQKMNIIVPIIISSHLPQSSQPSPGLTRPTTTLEREKTTRYEASFIFIFGPRAILTDQLFEAILSNQ